IRCCAGRFTPPLRRGWGSKPAPGFICTSIASPIVGTAGPHSAPCGPRPWCLPIGRGPPHPQGIYPGGFGHRKLGAVLEFAMLATFEQVVVEIRAVERRVNQVELAVFAHDGAVESGDDLVAIAEHQVILLLWPIRLGGADAEDRAAHRVHLA